MLKREGTIILIVLALSMSSAFSKIPSIDLALTPVLVPPYPEAAIRARMQGHLRVLVRFRDTKVETARIVSSELKSDVQDLDPEAARLIRNSLENTLLRTLQQWRSLFAKRLYETTVSVEYRLDETLDAADRGYLLRHGTHGILEGIVITGPLLR